VGRFLGGSFVTEMLQKGNSIFGFRIFPLLLPLRCRGRSRRRLPPFRRPVLVKEHSGASHVRDQRFQIFRGLLVRDQRAECAISIRRLVQEASGRFRSLAKISERQLNSAAAPSTVFIVPFAGPTTSCARLTIRSRSRAVFEKSSVVVFSSRRFPRRFSGSSR